MSCRLCITPCGSEKIWKKHPEVGAVPAKNVYTGTFARACHSYADKFFDKWVILSAKYGFILPDEIIPENYDVCFHKPSPEVITIDQLKQQVRDKQLTVYDEIVVVAGSKYTKMVQSAFGENHIYSFSLIGCRGMGYMIQRLNRAIVANQEM